MGVGGCCGKGLFVDFEKLCCFVYVTVGERRTIVSSIDISSLTYPKNEMYTVLSLTICFSLSPCPRLSSADDCLSMSSIRNVMSAQASRNLVAVAMLLTFLH